MSVKTVVPWLNLNMSELKDMTWNYTEKWRPPFWAALVVKTCRLTSLCGVNDNRWYHKKKRNSEGWRLKNIFWAASDLLARLHPACFATTTYPQSQIGGYFFQSLIHMCTCFIFFDTGIIFWEAMNLQSGYSLFCHFPDYF